MKISITFILLTIIIYSTASAQNDNFISFNKKTDIIHKQKKSTNSYNVYFDKEKNTIIKHIEKPIEMVTSTNIFGELSIYYPELNQISYQQVKASSSKINLIYYFANNQTDNLGLLEEGFKVVSKEYDENYLVTFWKSTNNLLKIDKVKIVFENGIPIYAEYLDKKKYILKKIYYTNYLDLKSFRLPTKIIEISYISLNDSIINRTIFSNINVLNQPNSSFFNFKAPEDAKPFEKQ